MIASVRCERCGGEIEYAIEDEPEGVTCPTCAHDQAPPRRARQVAAELLPAPGPSPAVALPLVKSGSSPLAREADLRPAYPARLQAKLRVCPACGFYGLPGRQLAGQAWAEVLLWLLCLLPGLLYTVHRHADRQEQCPGCGGLGLIPSGSPIARDLIQRHGLYLSSIPRWSWTNPLLSGVLKLGIFIALLILLSILMQALTGGFR